MSTAQPQATLLPAEEAGPGDVYDVRISVVSAETLRALRFTRTSDAMNELQRCRRCPMRALRRHRRPGTGPAG